jgi:predicted RNase H-like HicB family nuclease
MSKKPRVKYIAKVDPPYPFEAYAHIISPLDDADGGGFLITFPDLPGCISDGATEAEALANGRDAFHAVIAARSDAGEDIPAPCYRPLIPVADVSGKFVARMPRTVHAQLVDLARAEGVSLNTLVLTFIAQGIGRHTPLSTR